MEWRILVVDDEVAQDAVDLIKEHKVMHAPDSIICETCEDFSAAVTLLSNERFDLVILDLKGDGINEEDDYAGEKLYEQLKGLRFIPVVFYTGFAEKVKYLESPFVRVVAKGDNPNDLRTAIKEAFGTKLPKLVRYIEEEQRKFMWESTERIWAKEFDKKNSVDLVYLLARRLANSLSNDLIRNYLATEGVAGDVPQLDKVHAVEFYVWPPLSKYFLFGDIFIRRNDEKNEYVVALTPSCDHAQNKADFILLAKCKYLKETPPGSNVMGSVTAGTDVTKTQKNELFNYIRDNSSPVDRYKYLPGTNFIPDLLVDLQDTMTVTPNDLNSGVAGFERLASLDSPFAESLQVKMTRYFGRIGTPDLDADLAFERFKIRD